MLSAAAFAAPLLARIGSRAKSLSNQRDTDRDAVDVSACRAVSVLVSAIWARIRTFIAWPASACQCMQLCLHYACHAPNSRYKRRPLRALAAARAGSYIAISRIGKRLESEWPSSPWRNPKGGSGKSTSTLVLATFLAHGPGASVCIIDADPEPTHPRLAGQMATRPQPSRS